MFRQLAAAKLNEEGPDHLLRAFFVCGAGTSRGRDILSSFAEAENEGMAWAQSERMV
jgi:hypothetical protein